MSTSKIFKNISYAVVANVFNAIATVITSILIPRAFNNDIDSYGYYQIYFFYASYVGFFHFGLCDGILLRIGGDEYGSLDKSLYSSQFWILALAETIIAASVTAGVHCIFPDFIYRYIYTFVCGNLIVLNLQTYILYLLQGTARIKEYSIITISYRLLYCVFIVCSLILNYSDVKLFVAIDLLSKLVSLVVGVYWCKDIILHKIVISKEVIRNIKENITSGVKLLVANISGLLTNGIVRIGIQTHWSVSTYGKVSLSLTLTQIFLTIINAVSLVLYPMLRRTDNSRLPILYGHLRNVIVYMISTCFIFFHPICHVLIRYLPQYKDSFTYLAILMPLSLYSIKSALIVNTLLKVYRKEKTIMTANVISIFGAVVTTAISIFIFDSLEMSLFAILVNTMIMCIISDISLCKVMKVSNIPDIIEELIITCLFIVSNWVIRGVMGMAYYSVFAVILLLLRRKSIQRSIMYMRNSARKSAI